MSLNHKRIEMLSLLINKVIFMVSFEMIIKISFGKIFFFTHKTFKNVSLGMLGIDMSVEDGFRGKAFQANMTLFSI